jgi:hypothetical protein
MRFRLPAIVCGLIISTLARCSSAAEPRLLGRVEISPTLSDRSNEVGTFEGGVPANQWGAFGSGIAWLGQGNRYAVISDRGPADGKAAYRCRYHIVDIVVNEKSAPSIKVDLVQTHLLSNTAGTPLVGSLTALSESQDSHALRFDPEAIRVLPNGHLLISDEYGPSILEFTAEGHQVGQLLVPSRFSPLHPAADPSAELPPINVRGRQPNRGLECLAISPKGDFVFALLQSPLIQDGGLDEMNKRVGTNSRMLEINRATGATREFLYPLDAAANGCNEIEYLAPGRFLVIERDSKAGAEAGAKKIVEIDIRAATDISKIGSLPATALPAGVIPISKRPFLDLLDPRWKFAGETFPEKIEGIAFGPRLNDGSRVLLITSDNDFLPAPTQIYAFAYRDE